MEAYEFGKENEKKIVLIPGNMMSYRQFEKLIPLLEKKYHVIAISTDGYDDKGTIFTTAKASADKLAEYIAEHLGGEIELVFGESFGSATAGMLFHEQKVKARSLIMNGPQYMNIGVFSKILSYIIPRNQYRLISRIKSMDKLPLLLRLYTRGNDDKLKEQFQYAAKDISLATLQNCMSEALDLYNEIDRYEPDPDAKVSVWFGEKEPNMKKSITKLKRAYPNAQIHGFRGLGHGEIISDPELMASEIDRFIEGGAKK